MTKDNKSSKGETKSKAPKEKSKSTTKKKTGVKEAAPKGKVVKNKASKKVAAQKNAQAVKSKASAKKVVKKKEDAEGKKVKPAKAVKAIKTSAVKEKVKPAKSVKVVKAAPAKKAAAAKKAAGVKKAVSPIKGKVVKVKSASKVTKVAKVKKESAATKKIVAAKEVARAEPEQSRQPEQIQHAAGELPVILQILPELKSGGVERGTVEIAKAGSELGYKMLVASGGGNLVTQLERVQAIHIKLPLASKNPFVIFDNIRHIVQLIKKYNVDIVHARSRAPAWSAYFAAKKAGCHFITTFHGSYSFREPLKKLYNSVMTKGEIVIAISEFIKQHIIKDYGVEEEQIRLIPRGVDLEQFTRDKVHKVRMINMAAKYRIELDMPVILLPARFTRWKGHAFLIDALALLKEEKFVCVMAGYDKKHDGYYQELEKRVEVKNLFNKIRMIGDVSDMPTLYSLSDIVVSSSIRPEAFGRVAIEGQAMEKLVVATNHGGSCETIINGKTGWLVEPDDVEGLAKALREVLNISAKQRKEIVTKARKNIEQNFSMDNMVKKTFAVYDEVLGRKKI